MFHVAMWQVLNSRSNPAHPYHRFGTGNFKTLLEDTAAKGAALLKIDAFERKKSVEAIQENLWNQLVWISESKEKHVESGI